MLNTHLLALRACMANESGTYPIKPISFRIVSHPAVPTASPKETDKNMKFVGRAIQPIDTRRGLPDNNDRSDRLALLRTRKQLPGGIVWCALAL